MAYFGQAFQTGPNPAGYLLTTIKLKMRDGTGTATDRSVPWSLWVSSRLHSGDVLAARAVLQAAPMLCQHEPACLRCGPRSPAAGAACRTSGACRPTQTLPPAAPLLQDFSSTTNWPTAQVPDSQQYVDVTMPASIALVSADSARCKGWRLPGARALVRSPPPRPRSMRRPPLPPPCPLPQVTFELGSPWTLAPNTNYTVLLGLPATGGYSFNFGTGAGTPVVAPGFAGRGMVAGERTRFAGKVWRCGGPTPAPLQPKLQPKLQPHAEWRPRRAATARTSHPAVLHICKPTASRFSGKLDVVANIHDDHEPGRHRGHVRHQPAAAGGRACSSPRRRGCAASGTLRARSGRLASRARHGWEAAAVRAPVRGCPLLFSPSASQQRVRA